MVFLKQFRGKEKAISKKFKVFSAQGKFQIGDCNNVEFQKKLELIKILFIIVGVQFYCKFYKIDYDNKLNINPIQKHIDYGLKE